MKEFDITRVWKVLWWGKYLILLSIILGAAGGFSKHRSQKRNWTLYINSINVSNLDFFQENYFLRSVAPLLERVSISTSSFEGRIKSLIFFGEKKKILNALNDLKGLYIKFNLSEIMMDRERKMEEEMKIIRDNSNSMVFFRERIRILDKIKNNYPRNFSQASFNYKNVDILPPQVQRFVFLYRIANREATNRILQEKIKLEKQRINSIRKVLGLPDRKLGEEFCGRLGAELFNWDNYLRDKRISFCSTLNVILSHTHWQSQKISGKFIILSWAIAGLFVGIFIVLLLGAVAWREE